MLLWKSFKMTPFGLNVGQKKSSHTGCLTLLRYQKWLTFLFCPANIRCHAIHVN
ncbi:hypothetical protein J2X54_001688 [Duganella sp. 3397]|nr:hypothetical protein [Duganella sp. 3397]